MHIIFNSRRIVLVTVLSTLWAGAFARAQQGPSIAKDSVQVLASHISGSEDAPKDKDLQWKPGISFRVNGPIPDGSQLHIQFGYPGKPDWAKFSCKPGDASEGNSLVIDECLAPDKMTTDYTGPVDFSIRLHNELAGADTMLFSGKANVKKFVGPAGPQYPEFYVDEDWRIPIGYVFFEKDNGHGNAPFLNVLFWYRGNPATVQAHLFYKGKDIAKFEQPGNEGSDWKPAKNQWSFAKCQFLGVYPTDPGDDGYDPKFGVAKNPGPYEVKVLINGKLARSIKFTVNSDGSFDNGIAKANKLGSDRVIVPAQVLDNRSPLDANAWKTGAFYGNPFSGFAAPQ